MPYYCTVPRCTSMAGKAKNVSFHQFPRDEELAKLWNKILKRGKPYTKYSKVCSLHFTPDDYTITSVGKNKGQWRTLRKDAIPTQNLPSESPTPYQRKQWGSWSHNTPANNVLDPTIQQQVAQAIYMQTMLAMQAVGAAEIPALNPSNGLPQLPVSTESLPHSSNTPDTDILKRKQTNTNEKSTSYKCTECSKCFKDPDVFMLHKRSHEKNEKENFNLNLTLQANPILANLLKTNTENSNIFDSNVFSMENLLMTALAANMEGYMRNFASMIKNEDRSDLGHDRGDLSHDRGSLGRDRGDLSHDRGRLGRDMDDLSHDRGYLSRDSTYGENIHHSGGSIIPNRVHSSQKGSQNEHSPLDSDNGTLSHDIDDLSHDRGNMNRDRILSTNSNESNSDIGSNTNTEVNGRDLFREKIIELYRNNDNDRSIRYYENDSNHEDEGGHVTSTDDRGAMSSDRAVMSDDRVCNGVTNGDNDSQGVDGPVCDSDLNESIDSNNLVIDETF